MRKFSVNFSKAGDFLATLLLAAMTSIGMMTTITFLKDRFPFAYSVVFGIIMALGAIWYLRDCLVGPFREGLILAKPKPEGQR